MSALQQQQLTCWGESVRAFAVRGDFDDCQRIVKSAFANRAWAEAKGLLSANSINLGRLLPQTVYYAAASLWYLRERGALAGFRGPDWEPGQRSRGVLGPADGTAGYARSFSRRTQMTPSQLISRPARGNHIRPLPLSANAMDVGNPSNMERLLDLHAEITELRQMAQSFSVGDQEIADTIARDYSSSGRTLVPAHRHRGPCRAERLASPHWIIVATAHPAKFESMVEPLIGRPLNMPPSLAQSFEAPSRFEEIDPEFEALREALG